MDTKNKKSFMGVCSSMIYLSIQRSWENSWRCWTWCCLAEDSRGLNPQSSYSPPCNSFQTHRTCLLCSEFRSKIQLIWWNWGAQGREESVPFSACPQNSGDKEEWGSSAPSLPYQTLPGLWKWKSLGNTEPRRLHLNLLGGFVPGSPASFAVTWRGETQSNN